jgi:hypothetical protein
VIERIGPTERNAGIAARSGTTADLPILLDVTLGRTDAGGPNQQSSVTGEIAAPVPARPDV